MLRLGIVGLPNVGKSTLFNALTSGNAVVASYPFATVDPNLGVVEVPEARLLKLAEIVQPKRVVPAAVEFADIAGLVKGASHGEGLGNEFLSHIRGVDAIIHVIRCFEDTEIPHVMGSVDPVRDHDVVTTELAIADLSVVERRLAKAQKTAAPGDADAKAEVATLERVLADLNAGRGAQEAGENEDTTHFLRRLGLLTAKPILYAANVNEEDMAAGASRLADALRAAIQALREEATVVLFSAKFEAELAELPAGEQAEFLAGAESGLERLIHAGYGLLGLLTFFTVNENEAHAWTLSVGGTAFDAAGKVHSDFQRGFIGAETVSYEQFVEHGGYKRTREAGAVRIEGRDYVVQDGDVLLFRFNL